MGNCQAIDAAALVIQHPSGKIERFYWPILASEVMKMNPGHYVSLIIPLPNNNNNVQKDQDQDKDKGSNNSQEEKKSISSNTNSVVQYTRVKLLRPTDTLSLGHAYRLVTTQEVMKVLRAKKYAKMKQQQQQPESGDKSRILPPEKEISDCEARKRPHSDKVKDKEQDHQATKHRPRAPSISSATLKSKSWRPSLQSISEAIS